MKKMIFLILAVLAIAVIGCVAVLFNTSRGQIMDGDGMVNTYKQITQEEAKKMMEEGEGYIILDVRTEEEFNEGHIPGAICIPNEEIVDTRPAQLPDVDQVILIYCRSGRRSKEAAQKLFDMGYTHIYEFGGIIDWTGEVTSAEEA